MQIQPVVGLHEPGAGVAVHQGVAGFLEQRAGGVEQGACFVFRHFQLARIGQHQVVAGDMEMHRMQHEPGAGLGLQAVAAHQRVGCRRAVFQQRIVGPELACQPGFMRQGPGKRIECFALRGSGAGQQHGQRGRVALLHQIFGQVRRRQAERQEDIELTHATIIECMAHCWMHVGLASLSMLPQSQGLGTSFRPFQEHFF